VSNFSGWQTARAAAWQQAWPGRAPLVAAQVEYSLLERGVEREVVPACAALGLGLLPWSPLGRGVLTGKYRQGRPADSRAASPHFGPFVARYLRPGCSGIVEAVLTAADGPAWSPRCSARGPWASCSAPSPPSGSPSPRRSSGRWTTCRRSRWAIRKFRADQTGVRRGG
jgi:hypothetical protein